MKKMGLFEISYVWKRVVADVTCVERESNFMTLRV